MSMTNNLAQPDVQASGPTKAPEPNLIGLSLVGAIVTALAAGPVTLFFGMTILMIRDGTFTFSIDPGDLAEALVGGCKAGLIGSVPAAVINALALGWLALHGRDKLGLAIGSGLVLGGAIGLLACVILSSFNETGSDLTLDALIRDLPFALPFIVTGTLMGALHWRIAIHPCRRWRLTHARAGLQAME